MSRTALRAVFLLVLGGLGACAGPRGPAESWSPDAADLLYASNHEGNSEVYLLRAGEATPVNLTRHPAGDNWPVWSPDGGRIAFQSRRTGNLDIWLMNADGSDQIQLTHDPEADYLPAWSPDGALLAFTSWRREEGDAESAPHFYVMNPDGTHPRRLIAESPKTSSGVAFARDGARILYTRLVGEQGDLFTADPDGSGETRLTDDDAYDGTAAYSPGGDRIAFYSDRDSVSDLVVMQADGSGRRVVVHGGRAWYPRWSPDGRWLVYTAAVPASQDTNLDVLAVQLDGRSDPISLADGPGRQSEGSWRPVR